MAHDQRNRFLEWSKSLGMTRRTALKLLKHMPALLDLLSILHRSCQ